MLSFDSGLTNALKNANTTAFWVLKLYYNDESAFIGVSDRHRQDGSDIYYGLVASWGTYRQSLNFFNFTTSIGNMSITLINAEKSIQGKRFSDLLSDYNFANRKWELFLNTNETSTLDTSARMIASGVISGEIDYDSNNVTLTLFDNTTRHHKTIPANTVASATYTNAPANNIGKPIPIAYGDFHEKTDIGTIPTTHFDRFKQFYKGAFPAIITDKYDVGVAGSEAKVDSQAVHTLDNENVYYYKSGNYGTLTGTVDATSNNPVIEFEGSRCKVYFPLSSSGFTTSGTGTHTNEANISNGDFGDSSKTTIAVTDGNNVTINYGIEPISKMGEYVSATALAKFGTVSATPAGLSFLKIGGVAFSSVSTNDEKEATLSFSDPEKSSWDLTGGIPLLLNSNSGAGSFTIEISEMGMVVEFDIDDIESHEVDESYEIGPIEVSAGVMVEDVVVVVPRQIVPRTRTLLTPSKIDYVYCSGKGRKYGAWIDTVNSSTRNLQNGDAADPGYAANDLIENPVYMIEDILRTELSLDPSTTGADIDISTFDYSGNTTNGYLKDIYEDAVSDVNFAFSQYKFINSKDLIDRLAKLCFSYVFIGGDGKFKIKTLRRADDYSSADQTIDFNDIDLGKVGKTSLGAVKNSILIKYDHDYGAKQNKSEATATDATSAGNTVSGYSLNPSSGDASYMKFELDANEILDSTTATKLAEAYLYLMKDRHDTVNFTCVRPKYNHLEIGDIINFSNWPTDLKVYGQTMGGSWDSTTDTFSSVTTTWDNMAAGYFIVADITKTVTGCSIKAIKVS